MGQKYILKKYSKNGLGWVKNTYSKEDQKMLVGSPQGYAIDILKKWCLHTVSMTEEAIDTLFKHYFGKMSMAYPSGQPATIF